jgi:hypothetical protein
MIEVKSGATHIKSRSAFGLFATPALAANYHDYHAWLRPNDSVLVNYHPGYAGAVLSHRDRTKADCKAGKDRAKGVTPYQPRTCATLAPAA